MNDKTEAATCDNQSCDETVYIDSHCNLTEGPGGTGGSVELDVLVNTEICVFNESGCPVSLSFDTTLFGSAPDSLAIGACTQLVVQAGARNTNFVLGISCECMEGAGHTNPEVKVGDGEEDP